MDKVDKLKSLRQFNKKYVNIVIAISALGVSVNFLYVY